MGLYSANEIVKKLNGVTTRQILDIAEKGLITPARETTGVGSPRLYDFQNIFEICICLTVRGRIPNSNLETAHSVTYKLLRLIIDNNIKSGLIVITSNRRGEYMFNVHDRDMPTHNDGLNIQSYCYLTVEIGSIYSLLKYLFLAD